MIASIRLARARSKRPTRERSAAGLDGPLHVPVGLALRDVAALVSPLFTPGESELDLRPAVLEVELRRDERQALLGDLARQGIDLVPVEEELAIPIGVMVGDVALVVDRDVGTDEPGLPIAYVRIGLLERGTSIPERLDLRPGQHEAGLHAVEKVVIVPRPAVVDDQMLSLLGHMQAV